MAVENELLLSNIYVEDLIGRIRSDKASFEASDWTACLIFAIQKKNDEMFSIVLQKYLEGKADFDLNAPIQNGLNFLSLAIMHNHFEYFQKLLLLGASPLVLVGRNIAKMNQKLRQVSAYCDSLHMTPFSIAVDLGRVEMIKSMRAYVDKKDLIYQALRIVSSKDKEEIRAHLLVDCEEELKKILFEKARENDFKAVLNLLKLNVLKKLDIEDETGESLLNQVVRSKAYDTFVVLKEARDDGLVSFDENFVSQQTTPLNEAILLHQDNFVKKLLFMGANPLQNLGEIYSDVSQKTINKTPLYTLVSKFLEDKEAYGDILFYITCLLPEVALASEAVKIAKFMDKRRVYKILLKNSSNLSDMPVYNDRMIKAVREGDVDLVSFLMKRNVSVVEPVGDTTPLYEAVKLGKTDVLKVFVDELPVKKLEMPFKGISPFLVAVWYQQEEAALLLARAGVQIPDAFTTGQSVLGTIMEFDMPVLLNELLVKKSKLKSSKALQEVFWKAVSLKRNRIVKVLCDLKVDMSYQNTFGTNLFLLATKKRNFEAVRLLLKSGMDIESVDGEKFSALHYSILTKDEKTFNFLIENGANVNAQNIYGQTPLMMAAQKGLVKMAAVLIENRADGLMKDQNGKTAFYYYQKYKEKFLKTKNCLNQKIKE